MWTKPEIDQLRQLASEGMCKLKVAAVMGKGVDDVCQMCRAIGLKLSRSRIQPIKHWTEQEYQFALNLYEAGLTWEQVGNEMGRSKSSVMNAVKRYTGYAPPEREPDVGPAIGQTGDDRAYVKDCKLGSAILEGLISDLINRMTPGEVADVLGAPRVVEPGAERFIRGQFAERRLAA